MSVQGYGSLYKQSDYDTVDWQRLQRKLEIEKNLPKRRRRITCISLCLSPITFPIWCVESSILACVAAVADNFKDPLCYCFCGGCVWDMFRFQLRLCYPCHGRVSDSCVATCTSYVGIFCSIFYPLHACPKADCFGEAAFTGGFFSDWNTSSSLPWAEGGSPYMLPPERQAMDFYPVKQKEKQKREAQNIEEARKKREKEEQDKRAEAEQRRAARKAEEERQRLEQEALAKLESESPELVSAWRQEALLEEQNALLKQQIALLAAQQRE